MTRQEPEPRGELRPCWPPVKLRPLPPLEPGESWPAYWERFKAGG